MSNTNAKESMYQKMKDYLDGLRPEDRRICPSKGACACRGCASSGSLPIKQHHLDLYNKGELK